MSIKFNMDDFGNDVINFTRKLFEDETLKIEIMDESEFIDAEKERLSNYTIDILSAKKYDIKKQLQVYFVIEKELQQYNFHDETMYGFFNVIQCSGNIEFNVLEKADEMGREYNR